MAILVLLPSGGSPARGEPWLPASMIYLSGSVPTGVSPRTEPGTLPINYAYTDPIMGHDEFFLGFVTAKLDPPTIDLGGYGEDLYHSPGSTSPYVAGVSGQLKYYFAIDNPLCIYELPVPVVFASKIRVWARNTDPQEDWSQADVRLRVGIYDITTGKDTWYSTPSEHLGVVAVPGNTHVVETTQLFVGRRDYFPGQIGAVSMTATGALIFNSGGTWTEGGGSFQAYIDPLIQIDPDFMVEVNGQMRRGSEVFPIYFSQGIRQVPEPTAALLALVGVALLALESLACRTARRT